MLDLKARAAALIEMVGRDAPESAGEPFVESLIACCRSLLDADESALTVALLDSARAHELRSDVLAFRFGVLRARAMVLKGDNDDAYRYSTNLLDRFPAPARGFELDWFELRIFRAWALWQVNRADDAVRMLKEIRKELLRLPDSYALAMCALQLSGAELTSGHLESARSFALEGLVSAKRCGSRYIEGVALANIGRIDRASCRWAAAEDGARESTALFRDYGNKREESVGLRNLAILRWKRGRLAEAGELCRRCIAQARASGSAMHEWYSCLLSGMVELHKGQFVVARQLFTTHAGWELPRAESRPSLLTAEFLGDIHLEQGQADLALARYDEVWPKALALVPKGDIVAELRRRRAECYYLLGRFEQAREEARTGLDHCRELGDRYEEAATYRVLALTSAALGRADEAKRWFDQGFAYYDDIETPYEWGKLWLAYGDWLRSPHAAEYADERGALDAYHAARDHFDRMGAAARLAEANARIAELAKGPSAQRDPMHAEGTPRLGRSRRRPPGSADIDRRSAWARETFGFITRHKPVLDLLSDVAKLASAGSPMLILGESGTGKELIAQGVHTLSKRAGAFVPINCGALPRDVIESELFGHVQGAFTGASREKAGLFEVCDGGTVFLDEIAEMSIELQSRLLRFLETGEIRRVGANRMIAVDTLVVAATNRERAALERGDGFRPDLYYRLAHAVVVLPPLRRRGDDIVLLAHHFLDEACREQGKRLTLSEGAQQRLAGHPWPGNVRQLKAALRRLSILAPPEHEIAANEVHLDESDVASTLSEELEQAERRRMVEALAQSAGSRSEAARALGMARTTFVTKMKRYGIR